MAVTTDLQVYVNCVIYSCLCQIVSLLLCAVAAYTRAISEVVSVEEGRSVNISCNSVGIPTPTIVWQMNNQTVPFRPTEDTMEPLDRGFESFLQDVMLGRINSTIVIDNARYPNNNGTYICNGTNEVDSSYSSINVLVIGMYQPYKKFCREVFLTMFEPEPSLYLPIMVVGCVRIQQCILLALNQAVPYCAILLLMLRNIIM